MPISTPAEIRQRCVAKAGRGLLAAAYEYQRMVREVLSVPAKRAVYLTDRVGKKGSVITPYRAVDHAIPGAPPRKLSGDLRRTMAVDASKFNGTDGVIRVGPGKVYGRPLELEMDHPFLMPTLRNNLANLQTVAGYVFQTKGAA